MLEIDAETTARRAGLSADQMRGLLEADLISAAVADRGFVQLVESEWLPDGDDDVPGLKP